MVQKIPVHYDKPRSQLNDIYIDSTEDESDDDTPRSYEVANNTSSNSTKPTTKEKGGDTKLNPLESSTLSSSVEFAENDEHIYEDSTDMDNAFGDDGSIYENANFSPRGSLKKMISSPTILPSHAKPKQAVSSRTKSTSGTSFSQRKGHRHTPDDYEDPDAIQAMPDIGDYVEMDSNQHNTYIDPEDLKRVSSCSSATASSGSGTSYQRSESASSVPGPSELQLHCVLSYLLVLLLKY